MNISYINLIIISLFSILFTLSVVQSNSIIQIKNGLIRGTSGISAKGRHFDSFLGIRYGKAPEGLDRFKDPTPPEPWLGIWDATNFGNECLQWNYITESPRLLGSEECLFLNVYSPKLPQKTEDNKLLLDVFVFIHGGGYMFGTSAIYGPEILMDRDVVFVTLNYRLGPLGFLSTEDETLTGNMGLKDQVLALTWVQQNIKYFGGNPESVTITGCSAGGASVHFHFISPLSKGLFHRGISQSGTVLQPWTLQEAAREKANLLGASLGCPTNDSQFLIDCLRERPANQIVQLVDKFLYWNYNPFSPFGPVVEKHGNNPFLSEEPIDALLAGHLQNSPWISSVTAAEGLFPASVFIANPKELKYLEDNWSRLAAHLLDYNYTVSPSQQDNVAEKIKQYYFPKKGFKENEQIDGVIKMLSDRHFALDGARGAKIHSSSVSSPVYFYRFSYRGKHSLSEYLTKTNIDFGASHTDDSCYVLNCSFLNTGETKTDLAMREFFLDMWVKFAKSENNLFVNDILWEPISPHQENFRFLEIKHPHEIAMRTEANFGSPDLWENLPIEEAQMKFPLYTYSKKPQNNEL